MSVSAAHAKLKKASKDLVSRWTQTRLAWQDEVSAQYEERHLAPVLSRLRTAEQAMARMDALLAQLHKDCE